MADLYACDACHYFFKNEEAPIQCPDCGKYKVRKATSEEIKEYASRDLEADDD